VHTGSVTVTLHTLDTHRVAQAESQRHPLRRRPRVWMLHCHNIYHQEAGMMTSLGYST
jgi:FtsP/CotA-like multicopper oxidase with cupredoxin domain